MDRIAQLCAFLDPCESFADIGCDHGYCTQYMLKAALCRRAVIADISPKCLQKAERLLSRYIKSGECRSVCCDGLDGVEPCEQVLVAGMGGEEITAILRRCDLPPKFVLQPMRNARTLREFLLSRGAEILRDTVFESGGKFYTVIKGRACGRPTVYGEAELEFGGEYAAPEVQKFLRHEYEKKSEYLKRIPAGSDTKLAQEVSRLHGVLNSGS